MIEPNSLYLPKDIIASQGKSNTKDRDANPMARTETAHRTDLGKIAARHDIPSSEGPFLYTKEYGVEYSFAIKKGLSDIVADYNHSFIPLVNSNRESETDYQFATSHTGHPINFFVQIDMVGLPEDFLLSSAAMNQDSIQRRLRSNIFEIENSVAMYGMLQQIFSGETGQSGFKERYTTALKRIRQIHGREIALLAVTEEKYRSLRETEFGKTGDEPLTNTQVKDVSGFDRLFGPEEFFQYLQENDGQCEYLLYARTSDPISKLRKPNMQIDAPLLEDEETRRIIKANSITLNIDNPYSTTSEKINDTKAYLPLLGMGYEVGDSADLDSEGAHEYLLGQQADQFAKQTDTIVRAKPLKGFYGCYGHLRGDITSTEFRSELRRGIRQRGKYVIQPEMPASKLIDSQDGKEYVYIDRNFLFSDGVSAPMFLGGFRLMLPADSTEAQNGRIHGNRESVLAEIK